MENCWREADCADLDERGLLAYRSRLLGREVRVVNYGGGNTSCKLKYADFRGRPVDALLIKGSGVDLASVVPAGFAPLRLDDVRDLAQRPAVTDDEMVDYLRHCLLDPQAPRPSIETLLHAVIPARHIDHTHADAAISLCATEGGQTLAEHHFGRRMVWVPYVRPGFALGKRVAEALVGHDDADIIFLEKHGLVTWGDDSRRCYDRTIRVISELEALIAERGRGRQPFGSLLTPPLPVEERGLLSVEQRKVLHVDQSDDVLAFVGGEQAEALASVGAACPDHVMYTKVHPLFVPPTATTPAGQLPDLLQHAVQGYVERYRAYFAQQAASGQRQLDPMPRVVLLPGIGMVTAGIDAAAARNTAALYRRAIAVMRGAQALGRFVSLSPAEAFAIEYWPLELFKLSLRPPERELAGRVAVITGGASGIGRSTALRLAEEGAHVVLLDLNAEGAAATAQDIEQQHGPGRAAGMYCDVTSEQAIQAAFEAAILAYGGVDIVLPNAGLAASHSIEETSLAEWQKLHEVLTTGYFLTARAAFRAFRAQGLGGNLVIMSSKNGLSAAKNVLAYATAKAAELQMTRCLAEEGGAAGIRVNAVAPDAVFRNSGIWNAQWREERSRSHGVSLDDLEEFYRSRAVLKVNVYPEDVAEAVLFLCSDRSAKTTGCVLTVDGGVTTAYPR
jgi:rhamnulose-1-phosphate aldolase/alcohol dehydrogenase